MPQARDIGYPITPHLPGSCGTDDDTFGDEADLTRVLATCSVVHEKLDGLNLGIRTDGGIDCGPVLKDRAPTAAERTALLDLVTEASHAVRGCDGFTGMLQIYGELLDPQRAELDHWHVFDVFDETAGRFWSSARVDELATALGLARVPMVHVGPLPDLTAVEGLLNCSTGEREGVVLRVEAGPWLRERYKFVRRGFVKRDWSLL